MDIQEKIKTFKAELKQLEKAMQKPDFWQDKNRAIETQKEFSALKKKLELFESAKDKGEIVEIFLTGKYDSQSAILSVQAGAGGRDAQDWACLLFQMYQRYAVRKGWQWKVLSQSFGEAGGPEGRIGLKESLVQIKGKFAYGFLKKEQGVHRLVRISPFSAKKLRHTSFAKVEVLPVIEQGRGQEIKFRPEDVRIETFRSSGKGGQNVNKRETAVRVTHLASGLSASSQAERLQARNRQLAEQILLAKLAALKEKENKKELKELKGKRVPVDFGQQIRSYVLHPYQLVKDLRTAVETSDVNGVLDGNIDEFIEAEIKL